MTNPETQITPEEAGTLFRKAQQSDNPEARAIAERLRMAAACDKLVEQEQAKLDTYIASTKPAREAVREAEAKVVQLEAALAWHESQVATAREWVTETKAALVPLDGYIVSLKSAVTTAKREAGEIWDSLQK